jgi:hypothetical protein
MVNQEPSDREYTERGLERAILAYNSVTNSLSVAINDLRLSLAENYCKKQDLRDGINELQQVWKARLDSMDSRLKLFQWMALGAIAFGSLAISALALFHR